MERDAATHRDPISQRPYHFRSKDARAANHHDLHGGISSREGDLRHAGHMREMGGFAWPWLPQAPIPTPVQRPSTSGSSNVCTVAQECMLKMIALPKSTARLSQRLDDRRVKVIVTGGNSGVGGNGSHTRGCRSQRRHRLPHRPKAEQAAASMNGDVEIADLDLPDLTACESSPTRLRVDVLINTPGWGLTLRAPLTDSRPIWAPTTWATSR